MASAACNAGSGVSSSVMRNARVGFMANAPTKAVRRVRETWSFRERPHRSHFLWAKTAELFGSVQGTTRTLKEVKVTVTRAADVKVKSLMPRLSADFRAAEESVRVKPSLAGVDFSSWSG